MYEIEIGFKDGEDEISCQSCCCVSSRDGTDAVKSQTVIKSMDDETQWRLDVTPGSAPMANVLSSGDDDGGGDDPDEVAIDRREASERRERGERERRSITG